MMFFAHLVILEDFNQHQNIISSSLYHPGAVHKISSKSIPKFLSNIVYKQTYRQTDRRTNATKNIPSFCKGGNKTLIDMLFLVVDGILMPQTYDQAHNAFYYSYYSTLPFVWEFELVVWIWSLKIYRNFQGGLQVQYNFHGSVWVRWWCRWYN